MWWSMVPELRWSVIVVCRNVINHPNVWSFLMVYTTHLWWLVGWFIIAIPTLIIFTIQIVICIYLWDKPSKCSPCSIKPTTVWNYCSKFRLQLQEPFSPSQAPVRIGWKLEGQKPRNSNKSTIKTWPMQLTGSAYDTNINKLWLCPKSSGENVAKACRTSWTLASLHSWSCRVSSKCHVSSVYFAWPAILILIILHIASSKVII